MTSNPNQSLADLSAEGVSLRLDDLSRQRLQSGNLKFIADKHIVGVTTNPSIFQAALRNGLAYRRQIRELAARGAGLNEVILTTTTDDVRAATDLFSAAYTRTSGADGRVSIEVDPRLAHDTTGTIAQAQELFEIVHRNNVFIKIPATPAGLPAITAVIAEGISVNVTLIFSLSRYAEVINAYLTGLEQAKANGLDISRIHSVASFLMSRVDSEVDKRLKSIGSGDAAALLGKDAIANARLAYELHENAFTGARWNALVVDRANKQRPLWASTEVKDRGYDDTRYIVELVAPGTVTTAPEKPSTPSPITESSAATPFQAPTPRPVRCSPHYKKSASTSETSSKSSRPRVRRNSENPGPTFLTPLAGNWKWSVPLAESCGQRPQDARLPTVRRAATTIHQCRSPNELSQ